MRKWILLILCLTGCVDKKSGDTKFLLPWLNAQGVYELEEVTISTLSSINQVSGSAAQVYSQPLFSDSGYSDSPAEPRLTKVGDVYVPRDPESGIALAVYAQMERLQQFEQRLQTESQIRWPRKIGIELHMSGTPVMTHNNAHYFGAYDVMGIVPYTLDGVPLALNHGILAHEHFHAHFQSQVLNHMGQAVDKTISALESLFYLGFAGALPFPTRASPSANSIEALNSVVLRSWNEGLADFFAAIYMGKADFFNVSLPQVGRSRALDVAPTQLQSAKIFAQQVEGYNNESLVSYAYSQGTLLARMMYRLAYSGVEAPQEFLAHIMNHLANIPAQVGPGFSDGVMDFDRVVPVLLQDFPVNDAACVALTAVVSKDLMQRSFSACSK